MKKKLIVVILLIFIGIVATSTYYGLEVYKARKATLDIVNVFISSEAYRLKHTDLSEGQLDALIKVQDPNFYNHRGVEFKVEGSGWTTITQSLAKKFYFKEFKQGVPKIKQTLYAFFALDPLVSKDLQLDIFLNIIYFGNGIYGFSDAANFYFEKEFAELSQDEFLSLVASIIGPKNYNIKDYPIRNRDRVDKIKGYLEGSYEVKGLLDIYYDKK